MSLHLTAQDAVSVAADAPLSKGPGLRWGLMGRSMLYTSGGGPGGVRHFLYLTGPMKAGGPTWHRRT